MSLINKIVVVIASLIIIFIMSFTLFEKQHLAILDTVRSDSAYLIGEHNIDTKFKISSFSPGFFEPRSIEVKASNISKDKPNSLLIQIPITNVGLAKEYKGTLEFKLLSDSSISSIEITNNDKLVETTEKQVETKTTVTDNISFDSNSTKVMYSEKLIKIPFNFETSIDGRSFIIFRINFDSTDNFDLKLSNLRLNYTKEDITNEDDIVK
ncbi:MAG: hypothetical protein ACK5HS_00645 [Mycoplasmatales bacterium]